MHKLEKKIEHVKSMIISMGQVAVAFNGDVGSSILLKLSNSLLGDKCVAITVKSPFLPSPELVELKKIPKELRVSHIVTSLDRKSVNGIFSKENENCFRCKKAILTKLRKESSKLGISHILDGTKYTGHDELYNVLHANAEHGVSTPFIDLHLNDDDLYHMAHLLDIHVEEGFKSFCLAKRINGKLTKKRLRMLEKADILLNKLGIHNSGLTLDNDIGRLNVGHDDIEQVVLNSKKLGRSFRRYGFSGLKVELEK